MRIGLISDTHGLLRPEALQELRGSDAIVHAGDIGGQAILDRLAAIAPVTAVRGNNDIDAWADALPAACRIVLGSIAIDVLHDLKQWTAIRPAGIADVIVAGHSHRPQVERRDDGVLLINPGSAGPRRFRLPVTVAELRIDGSAIEARVIELDV